MGNVLELDAAANLGRVSRDLGTPISDVWVTVDVAFDSAYLTGLLAQAFSFPVVETLASDGSDQTVDIWQQIATAKWTWTSGTPTSFTPVAPIVAMQFYTVELHVTAGTPMTTAIWIDGVSVGALTTSDPLTDIEYLQLRGQGGWTGKVYFDNFKAGTTRGGTNIYTDGFETDLSGWADFTFDATIIADPGIAAAVPAAAPAPEMQRVGIAFTDGPLEPDPSWVWIDDLYPNLVSGYDIHSGKQTERDTTDTGTATVYLNDTAGLFDPANAGSPYFGLLDGKQIILQCWNPVTEEWLPQFRGHIDDYGFDVNPATKPGGAPVVVTVQIDCVDIFDFLGGFELAPGLDGKTAPSGKEGTVHYYGGVTPGSAQAVDDRITEVLTDAGIDSTRIVVFTGNVDLQAKSYDAGDSALMVLRDCADAELPTIANIYCDKTGRFVFHGRKSRFTPLTVEATTTPDIWDFNVWKVGDGLAIIADATRAQIRVLSYNRPRTEIINKAISYPENIAEADIPSQVYVDAPSIGTYGPHSWSATDLVLYFGSTTGNSANVESAKYAELIVKNHKDPRNTIKTIELKSLPPTDDRASSTWDTLCRAQISDVMNVRANYPGGTGIDSSSTAGAGEDYYIEGFSMRVRPLQAIQLGGFDYVECDYDISPAVWSMDTHGVFP